MNGKECAYPTCDRRARSRGLCSGHYGQLLRGVELTPLHPYVRRTADLQTKECSRCHEVKSWDEYSKRGNGTPQSACKACIRNYNNTKNAEMRRKAILWDQEQANKKTVGKDPQIIKEEAQ